MQNNFSIVELDLGVILLSAPCRHHLKCLVKSTTCLHLWQNTKRSDDATRFGYGQHSLLPL